jgi:hypothetical protein
MRISILLLVLLFTANAGVCAPTSAANKAAAVAGKPAVRVWGTQLQVRETPLLLLEREVHFGLIGVWRYEPDADRWLRVVKAPAPLETVIAPTRPEEAANARVLLELPEDIGLYYVSWLEDGVAHSSLAFNGPVGCNDLDGDAPPGKILACVPFEDSARAQFVPDPAIHCAAEPAEDPARKRAEEIAHSLKDAHVEAVGFHLRTQEMERTVRVDDPAEVDALVEQTIAALESEDVQEGKQRHRPNISIHIRFILTDNRDVHLRWVGLDMFWSVRSDKQPDHILPWVNIQSPSLTACFKDEFDNLLTETADD